MALSKDEILKDFSANEDVQAPTLLVDPEDLKRSVIEDQVAEMRRQGTKAPMVAPRTANPKNEAITGTQQARVVGMPEGLLTGALEGGGAAAGATAGALHGARLGLPFGPTGAIVGGTLGGMIGGGLGLAGTRAGVEGGKAAFGARPPITADEAIASGQRAMMEGVAGEGLFRTLQLAPMGKRIFMERLLGGNIAPEARATYDEAQKMGIHLTPGTLTESKAPRLIENTLRRTLGGGEKFRANDLNNELKLREAVDQWADATMGARLSTDDPSLSVHAYGDLVQKAVKNEVIPEQRAFVKALYQDLDQKTGGAKIVDTTDLYGQVQAIRDSLAKRGDTHKSAISALDDILERMSKKGPVTGLTVEREMDTPTKMIPGKSSVVMKKQVVKPSLKSEEQGTKPYDTGFVTPEESYITKLKTNTQYQAIPQESRVVGMKVTEKSDAPRQPVPLTFSEAQQIRTVLGSEVGSGGPALPANDMDKLKKTYALLTESMGKAAIDFSKATGKDINLSWALADTMNKRGKQLFNESIVAKAIEQNPEDVVKKVFQKNAITETRDLMRALSNKPEAVNAYRRGVVETLITEATNKDTGRIVGADFAKVARSRGEAVLKETLGETYPQFKRFLEIAERMPKQSEAGLIWFENGMYVVGSASAATSLAMGSVPAAAVALAAPSAWFLSSRRLATILTDKEKANKLLEVRSLKPGTQAFGRAMSQLGAIGVGEQGQPLDQTRPMPSSLPTTFSGENQP